jgi:hypothetical protein
LLPQARNGTKAIPSFQHNDVMEVVVDHAQHLIDLPHGRSLVVGAEQLLRIARGLGGADSRADGESGARIVQALRRLPIEQRADALAVALLRFGQKLDVESISQNRQISIWRVWQLEEQFRRAVAETRPSAVSPALA